MDKFIMKNIFLLIISVTNSFSHQINSENISHLSCNNLLISMIRNSSFGPRFCDKNLGFRFGFERTSDKRIRINFSRGDAIDRGGFYANFLLNLSSKRFFYIDPYPSIEIKINKKYIDFISKKCDSKHNLPMIFTARSSDIDI